MNVQALRTAVLLVLGYVVFGAAWIMLSDGVVLWVSREPHWIETAQRYKGLSFVVVTALLLLYVLYRSNLRLLAGDRDLAHRELRIRDLFESSIVPMAMGSIDGQFRAVNAAFCELTGYTEQELLGTYAMDLTHPDDRARDRLAIEELRQGRALIREKRYLRKDGSTVHVRIQTVTRRALQGSGLDVLVVFEDVSELVRQENSRKIAEERFAAVFDAACLGMYLLDAQGRALMVNPALVELSRHSAAELLADAALLPLPLEPPGAAEQTALQPVAHTTTQTYRRSDGSSVGVRVNASRAFDAAGQHRYTVVVVEDVSELDAALQAHRRNEERLHLVLEASRQGAYEWLAERGSTEFDASCLAIAGLPPERRYMADDYLDSLIHPDDVGRKRAAVLTVLQNPDIPLAIEMRWFHQVLRDWIWLRLRGRVVERDADGRARKLLGVVQEVTEERRLLEAQRRDAQRLRLAADGAGLGSWEYDPDSGEVQWDDQVYRLFGHARRDGLSIAEIMQRALPGGQYDELMQALAGASVNGSYEASGPIRLPDGQERWIASRARLIAGTGRLRRRLIGVSWDVTGEHARELAEASSRAKSDFLSRMSHELRTPLNAVIGFSQLMLGDVAEPPTLSQRYRLETIEASGKHLLAMIGDVLDTSRIDAGTMRVNLEPVDLQALAHDCLSLVNPLAQRDHIRLELAPADAPAWALADRVRTKQVLMNLLSNAIKYNRPDGSVVVRVEPPDATHRETVCVRVRDTGIGMSGQQIEHLYEPFNRLGREFSHREGTGMGLVITRGLLQAMDGRLWVDSQEGRGSEFSFALPSAHEVNAAAGANDRERDRPQAIGYGARRVVYLEDDAVNAEIVRAVLALRPQITTVVATTVQEGLAELREHGADLLLLDMHLPDGSGLDVVKTLQADPALARIPVVVVSADAMADQVDVALRAGARSYLTKPIDVAGSLAEVDRLLAAS